MNINQAVAFAESRNPNLTNGLDIKAAKDHCACRGKCGNHTGPCMSACMSGASTCKSCKPTVKAGGVGSGRKNEGYTTWLPGDTSPTHQNGYEKPAAYTPPAAKPTKAVNYTTWHPGDTSPTHQTSASSVKAGGPGSGRRKGADTFEKPSPLMGKFNKASDLAETHGFKSEDYADRAQDAEGTQKGRAYSDLAYQHQKISDHFEKAADAYDGGKEKVGDRHFGKGMELKKAVRSYGSR